MPVASVITRAYNAARYLGESTRSALDQTFRDLVLIIVDGGSNDQPLELAHQMQSREPSRVRVVSKPNGGPSAARDAGLAAASGEYMALPDADDVWKPEFLAREVAVFTDIPTVDLVTGNGWNLGGSRHGQPVRPFPDRRPAPTLASFISDERAVFVMTVFRRHVFEAVGDFDESLRGNEDFDCWMRAAIAGFRSHRNAEPLAWYRRRQDSLSADPMRMISGAIAVCGKLRPLLDGRPEAKSGLAAHVLRLLDSPDLARRLASTAHASCQRYWPTVRDHWLAVYRSASRNPVPATAVIGCPTS
jgi:glycosyltransferase involved in cell wall biosynthesis